MSKVSVIIPCYNAMPFLRATLASVFGQTYQPLDIIVIDDGSTDGSWEYICSIDNPNLTIKRNNGKGACAARNHGFELSTGTYIQFLDADDLLSPDKIEKQMMLLNKYPDCIAVCSTKHFYDEPENGKIVDRDFMFSTDQPPQFLLNLYGANGRFEMVQTSAWLTPRILIEKAGLWDESLSKDQDGEFFCRVVMASRGVQYEPNVINYYRKHVKGTNIANHYERNHIESQLKALNSKAKQLASQEHTESYRNAMALQYKFLAINAYPQFKDISNAAMETSNSFGKIEYLPVLGGRVIELLKFGFGWKFAKSIKGWFQSNQSLNILKK